MEGGGEKGYSLLLVIKLSLSFSLSDCLCLCLCLSLSVSLFLLSSSLPKTVKNKALGWGCMESWFDLQKEEKKNFKCKPNSIDKRFHYNLVILLFSQPIVPGFSAMQISPMF